MGRTILIVDRSRRWLNRVSRLFLASRYQTYTATDCDKALGLAERYSPDCILLGHCVSDAHIYRFYPFIRVSSDLRHPRIIIAVSRRQLRKSARYLKIADAVLVKEGCLSSLRAVVARVLRGAKWEKGSLRKGDLELSAADLTVARRFGLARKLSKEQFRLLSLLVERGPNLVPDNVIAERVFGAAANTQKPSALRALVHRLRGKLGTGLGRRIKSIRRHGWAYIPPRLRPRKTRYPL